MCEWLPSARSTDTVPEGIRRDLEEAPEWTNAAMARAYLAGQSVVLPLRGRDGGALGRGPSAA